MGFKFEKGHPRYGGRKVGTKNKNYLDPNFWSEKLYEVVENMEDKEKAEAMFRLMTMLFSKINNLPVTMEDSVRNAEQASAMLKSLEAPAVKDDINA